MIFKYFNLPVSSIALNLLFITTLYSQSSTSAALLLQSQGARGLALGESYVAIADGIHSLYWNPAGLATYREGLQLAFTHRPEIFTDFLNYEYGTLAYQINTHSAVGVNFSYVDFGRSTFESLHMYAYALGVSYSSEVFKDFTFGITFKRISQIAASTSAHALAADFGMLHRIRFNNHFLPGQLNLGVSLSNLGNKIEFIKGQGDPLPQFLRVGFAYEMVSHHSEAVTGLHNFAMLVSFEYQNLLNIRDDLSNEHIWEWGAGVEVRFLEILSFRFGYHERHPKTNQTFIGKTLETGMTGGVGVNLPIYLLLKMARPLIFRFDFASAPQGGWVENYQMYTFAIHWGF